MLPDIHAPRVIVASGMSGTGVTAVATTLQDAASSLDVIDAGSRWSDISEACAPGFERLIVVTTHDVLSVSTAYALVKMVRDRSADAPIEVLVNASEERDALRTYERIQGAANHFLGETIGYAGSVPEDRRNDAANASHPFNALGDDAIMALRDLATRLDDELGSTAVRGAWRHGERRLA